MLEDEALPLLGRHLVKPHHAREAFALRRKPRVLMRLLRIGGWRLTVVVGVALGLVVGGIAYAAIPDGSGLIHGCYAKRDGALRVVDTGDGGSCSATKDVALDWNQTGPSGSSGPSGPPGPGAFTFDESLDQSAPGVSNTVDFLTLDNGLRLRKACLVGSEVGDTAELTITGPPGPASFMQLSGTFTTLDVVSQILFSDPVTTGLVFRTASRFGINVIERIGTSGPSGHWARIDAMVFFGSPCRFSGMVTTSS